MIINAHLITLISSFTYLPAIEKQGHANIEYWHDGTLIYAHNYLSGSEFYDFDIVTAVYSDGSAKKFEIQKQIVIDKADWGTTILDYSTPETLTLVTCYPISSGETSLRLVIQLKIQEDFVCSKNCLWK